MCVTGEALNLASRWTLIRDDRGEPTGILVIDTDVTEQKQLEAQLIRAQRLEVVGAVAGGMAHDLNNALAPVLMGVQMLKKRHQDDTTRHLLDHIESSARRGAEMVRQVLFFARGRGGDTGPLDPGLLIKEVSRLARETFPQNLRVESQVADDLWPVDGNATQLHQVIVNLCVNARDAMPDGGTLTLAADNVTLGEQEASAMNNARPGDFVSIMVNDTGGGIPPEHLPRLFEAFFTTKPEGKGTGLGLPTVKRIVEGHSGFIQISSTPHEGTSFEVFLPRSLETTKPPTTSGEPTGQAGDGQTVLVVGHTTAVRELLGEALTNHGYDVRNTATPSDALERVAAGSWLPEAIVLGSNDPSIDGLELLAAFRRYLPTVPAILLGNGTSTSPIQPPDRVTFLNTPVSIPSLLRVLSQLLNERPPQDPAH